MLKLGVLGGISMYDKHLVEVIYKSDRGCGHGSEKQLEVIKINEVIQS